MLNIADLFEFITGTNPKDRSSLFVGEIILPFTVPTISWPTTPGRDYRVEFKDALADSAWQPLGGNIALIGGQGFVTELWPLTGQRFYRVVSF